MWQGFFCIKISGEQIITFVRITLIMTMMFGAFGRAHAMPSQQDVAFVLPLCSNGTMMFVALDASGNPVERQVVCPDCVAGLGLASVQTGLISFYNVEIRFHAHWCKKAQYEFISFDGFHQRGPPVLS